jgi:hypothetical protein
MTRFLVVSTLDLEAVKLRIFSAESPPRRHPHEWFFQTEYVFLYLRLNDR